MRYVLIALFCFACVSPAHGAKAPAQAAETLSFAELYRITVLGASTIDSGAPVLPYGETAAQYPAQIADYQVRVASASTAAAEPMAPRYSFSKAVLPEPSSPWLLLVSGLALALWVARRRLGYSL